MGGLRLVSALGARTRPERPAGEPAGHKEIVDLLVDQLPRDLPPPGLVLLSYAAPDVNGNQTVASYLNMRTGGQAHSFAVSGQGLGGPFSALRVARAYAGEAGTSVLAIVECRTPDGLDAPQEATGVLLAFGGAAGPLVEPAAADRPAALLREHGRLLVVLGPTADPAALGVPAGADVHRVPAGGYCTSVWLALARHWTRWSATYPAIALCDTDPLHGTGHVAVLHGMRDGAGSAGAAGRAAAEGSST
ncbi:hypothetical protein NMG29_37165 [Streptomyces cocklensis]|jgi:hypothetical protein|nr:hypothetical protein [Actinacidiphila cocklensis]MDD1063730.1 hypothetical protein [Actinacidiphila cocklensis]